MDIDSFLTGPLLWIVFIVLLSGIVIRTSFFLVSLLKNKKFKQVRWKFFFAALGRFLFPLHRAILSKPIYTAIRYVFHLCMVLVPLGFSGHIILWESSSLELSWTSIPDQLADILTILFIIIGILLLTRRIVFPEIRRRSTSFDYIFIILCVLPFLNGYFLTHGTLDSISFFLDNMFTIHVLSGSLMIVMVAFLLLRSRLDQQKCTGCAACEINCPTGTLESYDVGENRLFSYSHYPCVSCGECVNTCPENAAELRHEVSAVKLTRILQKLEIQSVKLKTCEKCGLRFAPEPHLEKVGLEIDENYLNYCPKCKKINYANSIRQMSPWTNR